MTFTGALLFAAIVLFFAGILAYAAAVMERRRFRRAAMLLPRDPTIGRDQQPQKPRGATEAELVTQQQRLRRNHEQKVDPWGMD